jgi:Rod binding domain-containing protein
MQTTALPFSRLVASRTVEPTNVEDAARQFESLLTKQLLKAARAAGEPLAEDRDSTADGYLDFAETILADALADSGALGLGRLILKELNSETVSADEI